MSERPVSFGPPDYTESGTEAVWTIVSLILSGPLVWGAVGAGLDWWLDISVFKVIGIVVGLVAAFYIIWFRFFRE